MNTPPLIGLVTGSDSDWPVLQAAARILKEHGVPYEAQVVSAHRTPDLLFEYAATARERGLRAIIAGAGGAAHLPGMVAAKTTLPVLGVPIPSRHLKGMDSMLSIVQMPKGVPVATFAIGEAGAANAALFAVSLLSVAQDGDAPATGSSSTTSAPASEIGCWHCNWRSRHDPATRHPRHAGGGQLGRYFVMAAHRLGYKVVVLDPDPASIAGAAADHHIVAPYDDQTALLELASRCEAISCEFENVPAATLALLEKQKPVRPAASAVRVCQDRREEKAFLRGADIPVAPYLALLPEEPIPAQASELFPAILKTAREGYDGKGQWQVSNLDELATALAASGVPCVLEKRLALEGEFALTLARSPSGAISALPLVQNWHSGGILDQTRSPANVPVLESEAKGIAEHIIAALDYVGVLTVEFFLVEGRLLVNELAPRPHNSGHPSLDNAACSQFELQVRALCDLPLPEQIAVRPALLINLLGISGSTAPPTGPPCWRCPACSCTSTARANPARPQDGPHHGNR